MPRTAARSNQIEPRNPRRLPREARREILLECALRISAERGIAGVRHAEIAAAAGVSVPTVFFYFPTRTALVDAVLAEVEGFYVALGERVHRSKRPAPEVVSAHAMAFAHSIDEYPDHAALLLNWSSSVRGEHWPRYQVLEGRVMTLLARTLARGQRQGSITSGIAPMDAARLIYGAAYLLGQQKLSGQSEPELSRFFQTVMHLLETTLAGNRGAAGKRTKSKPASLAGSARPVRTSDAPDPHLAPAAGVGARLTRLRRARVP